MKTVYLIETIGGRSGNVCSYLSELNANVVKFGSVAAARTAPGSADMILLVADRDVFKFSVDIEDVKAAPVFSGLPRLSLLAPELVEKFDGAAFMRNENTLSLPVDKMKFITTLAGLLKIPVRRVFQTVISVQVQDSGVRQTGVSVDFSETGMAFESAAAFSLGQNCMVTFVDPKSRKRLCLSSLIVRKKHPEPGGRIFYGVNFVSLDEQSNDDLSRFITGAA